MTLLLLKKEFTMKKRKIDWNDIKAIIELKTFYIAIVLFLIGIILIFTDHYAFKSKEGKYFFG